MHVPRRLSNDIGGLLKLFALPLGITDPRRQFMNTSQLLEIRLFSENTWFLAIFTVAQILPASHNDVRTGRGQIIRFIILWPFVSPFE